MSVKVQWPIVIEIREEIGKDDNLTKGEKIYISIKDKVKTNYLTKKVLEELGYTHRQSSGIKSDLIKKGYIKDDIKEDINLFV